MEIKNPDPEG